jgi:hypothetical protein
MFQDNKKNSDQPEEISKKPGDLEDPHGGVVYSLKIRVLSF